MIDAKAHINDLLRQAKRIEFGRLEKTALLEQAVKIADSHNELELGYDARRELVSACYFSGQPDKAIVAFSWCLAQHDRHPGKFDEWALMLNYKFIIEASIKFPQISLSKIAELLEDATRRFEPYLGGLHAIYQLQTWHYQHRGLTQEAERTYQLWQASPNSASADSEYTREGLSNCQTCQIFDRVTYQIFCGRDVEGINTAAPLLTKPLACSSSAKTIWAVLLLPLVRTGQLERALAYHRKGCPLVAHNRNFLEFIASHINYLTIVNNLAEATTLFGKHLVWALEAATLTDAFDFYLASSLLFNRLKETTKEITLRLPDAFPLHQASGQYNVQTLIDWLDEQIHSIADKFDERNKTDCFKVRINKNAELQSLFLP